MKFILRKANINDIKNIFELTNQDYVRKYSLNQQKITWENHYNWFQIAIKDPNIIFYVIESLHHEFIGQIRLKQDLDNHWEISISLLEKFHRLHIANNALQQIIEQNNNLTFIAKVREDNIPSIKFFQQLNFKKHDIIIVNNHKFFILQK